jgi:2-oxoglutarate ferredoxin oxidoreductase subunit delta
MKGMIVIDRERCKGCAYCVESCPAAVIIMEKRFNKKGFFTAHVEHEDKCTGCGLCAMMCPEIAIEVYNSVTHGEE